MKSACCQSVTRVPRATTSVQLVCSAQLVESGSRESTSASVTHARMHRWLPSAPRSASSYGVRRQHRTDNHRSACLPSESSVAWSPSTRALPIGMSAGPATRVEMRNINNNFQTVSWKHKVHPAIGFNSQGRRSRSNLTKI